MKLPTAHESVRHVGKLATPPEGSHGNPFEAAPTHSVDGKKRNEAK